jgi:hypothetical protein
MPQVQLNNQIFTAAQRKAATAGYASVDDYIADVVSHDLSEENGDQTPNLDYLFTPERLAHIDAAAAEVRDGKFYSTEQADEELAKRRAEWLQKNPR